jgi:hypothetical protein
MVSKGTLVATTTENPAIITQKNSEMSTTTLPQRRSYDFIILITLP